MRLKLILPIVVLLAIALVTAAFAIAGRAKASPVPASEVYAPCYSQKASVNTAKERDGDEGEDEDDDDDDGNLTVTLTAEEAAIIANLEVPGKIGHVELENEDGVAVYGVEILATDGSKHDVKVDANNGKVLKNDIDDDEDDSHGKKEKKAEKEDGD